VKYSDVIVIGGGVIGLACAWRLQKARLNVLLIERTETGREASHAAAGMIAVCDPHNDPAIQPLAEMSAALYLEFVHEVQDESRISVDLREEGVITFLDPSSYSKLHPRSQPLDDTKIKALESGVIPRENAYFLPERWVDPRALCNALLQAFLHHGGDVARGSRVAEVKKTELGLIVTTDKTIYSTANVINCAGAWAGQVDSNNFPIRPVKGQMLSVVPLANPEPPHVPALRHVVRAPEVYLVPRSDGRIIIGSTLEEAGFDKNVHPEIIQQLHHAAEAILPALKEMRIHEVWAGLRPGTPDGRPLIGKTGLPGSFIAAGHYRDGIMLAPATAEVITGLVLGNALEMDMRPFAPNRFQR
jgi:glycine oxidase